MSNWFSRLFHPGPSLGPIPSPAPIPEGIYPLGNAFLLVDDQGRPEVHIRVMNRNCFLILRPVGGWAIAEAEEVAASSGVRKVPAPELNYGTSTF